MAWAGGAPAVGGRPAWVAEAGREGWRGPERGSAAEARPGSAGDLTGNRLAPECLLALGGGAGWELAGPPPAEASLAHREFSCSSVSLVPELVSEADRRLLFPRSR